MTRTSITVVACAAAMCAGTALATPTAQQNCDKGRVVAWKVYTSCVDAVVAKAYSVDSLGGESFLQSAAASARCRHTYFKNWESFQRKASFTGSACIGSRFTNNGTTVTDNLTGLEWEKKTDDGTVHDKDNLYKWSTGFPYKGNGEAFAYFVLNINENSFAGANDWRIPTLEELQSIVLDFPCTGTFGGATCKCPSNPCMDPALDPANWPDYWSATSNLPDPSLAWYVKFWDADQSPINGYPSTFNGRKITPGFVRAVRGGL